MRRIKVFWRIYLYFLLVSVGALAVTSWYAARSLRLFHQEQVAAEIGARAKIVAREIPLLSDSQPEAIARLCKDVSRLTASRLTVIQPDGKVIGDSDENPAIMDNHGSRPEVAAALKGQSSQSIRYSDTSRRSLIYVAEPIRGKNNEVSGVVRVSLPLAVMDQSLATFYQYVTFGGLGVAAAFAFLALLLTRRLTAPLAQMRQVAEQFAAGDLNARVPIPDTEEFELLARTMNLMAGQLSERMRALARQHNEQAAVLANMTEGVLAVDREQRILHINPAACRLFGLKPDEGRGRHILEVVRHIALQEFIGLTIASDQPVERDIVFHDEKERFLQLHGVALKDEVGQTLGGLIVMTDVTRLKRLETLRRDFVANVSHELKTPLTTLKGCVETLSQGYSSTPEEMMRFVGMMGRQVGRLEAMVDDLLILSRLEHESEQGQIELLPGLVNDVAARAVQAFSSRADKKGIQLVLDSSDSLRAPIDAALLEQAVGNLIDNAIKYSDEESRITVTVTKAADQVEIRVTDEGIGIPKSHLDRIFERFYRVDQARSRAQGGTGLGLAIVKHIAIAHHGSVAVESTPGRGSTFSLRIPMRLSGAAL